MPVNVACEALKTGHRLALNYEGLYRIVEVHAVGTSGAENPVMRVWQTSGGSMGGDVSDWRLMHLDKATDLFDTDEISQAPRSGYNAGNQDMLSIVCKV